MSAEGLARRGFLRGLYGVSVALPLLDSLRPRLARAAAAPTKGFAVFVRSANGVAQASGTEPERFWPVQAPGPMTVDSLRTQSADRAVSELADYAPKLNIVRGLNRPFPTASCGHAESLAQCLTAFRPVAGSGNAAMATAESVDWRIARELNAAGQEPLTLMAGPLAAYIKEGLSWRSAKVRVPAQRSPLASYMSMMGLTAAPPDVQLRIARTRLSVNDLIRSEMQAVLSSTTLGTGDRQRLQQHFEAIRDTEVKVACQLDATVNQSLQSLTNPEANDVRVDAVKRHMDVIAYALSCGVTHVATLQIGEGNDLTRYTIDGQQLTKFHWISHRVEGDNGGPPIANAQLLHHKIDRLQLKMYKYLLDRLSAYPSPSGTGTLLDACAAVWLNDLSNGPPHGGNNVPWIIAGSANGVLRTGNYVDAGNVPLNQVLSTILTAVGLRKNGGVVDDVGDPSLPRGVIQSILNVT